MASVLLIGWRPKAVAALRVLGAHVTCVCRPGEDAEAEPAERPDRAVRVADPTHAEHVLAGLARQELAATDFDVVCSQHEFTMVTAAAIGGERSWMPVATALLLRDKAVQKAAIRRAGIRVADAVPIDAIDELATVGPFPQVLKPLADAGARDVLILRSARDVEQAIERLSAAGRHGPWLVESYVAGREHAIDGVVRDHRIEWLSIARYQTNVIEMRDGAPQLAIRQDRERDADLYRRAYALAEPAMRALGHRDGVFHMEAFLDDGFVFGECAGRVSGGIADAAIRLKLGLDVHEEWARAVLGRPPTPPGPGTGRTVATGYLPLPPGRLVSAPSAARIERRPGVREARVKLVPGDRVVDPRTSSDAGLGTVLLDGPSVAEVERRYADLVAWVRAESEVKADEPS